MGKKGFIVCFEGIDGSGKRTQTKLLSRSLSKTGIRQRRYSYPDYGSVYGKVIRSYLEGEAKLGRKEHFLLFLIDILKDRKQAESSLDKGEIVVMDRYFYTALAYICPSGLDYQSAKRIVKEMGFIAPSIVIYLDMPTELTPVRKTRQKGKMDKFEEDQRFLGEVKKMYERMMAERYGGAKWIRIDASQPIKKVHADVLEALKEAM